jgi:hypothetical protein
MQKRGVDVEMAVVGYGGVEVGWSSSAEEEGSGVEARPSAL